MLRSKRIAAIGSGIGVVALALILIAAQPGTAAPAIAPAALDPSVILQTGSAPSPSASLVVGTAPSVVLTGGYAPNVAPDWVPTWSYAYQWVDTFANAPGMRGSSQVGWLWGPATSFVFCRAEAGVVSNSSGTEHNKWWMWTELDTPSGMYGWVSAYYLSRWGNDEAKNNSGSDLPPCVH